MNLARVKPKKSGENRGVTHTCGSDEWFRHRNKSSAGGFRWACVKCGREKTAKFNRHYRDKALHVLGGCCVTCGFSDPRVLQVDHILGNGYLEANTRANLCVNIALGNRSAEDLQLLCANCHAIKTAEERSDATARQSVA